ncbi:MAG: CopL family metal-binding regulatory protein [Pseudoxanthomonas sp.]
MPTLSTLLRIFLCACLVANGTGAFAASAHANGIADTSTQPSATHHPARHASEAHASAAHDCCDGAPHDDHDAPANGDDGHRCKTNACHCPCAQPAGVVASPALLPPLALAGTAPASRCIDRDAPPVARMIRPPIA